MNDDERIGRYEIIEAGVETNPAENPERPVETTWGRRWRLRDDEGRDYAITFEADMAFQAALGRVDDAVRRVFESNGRSLIEEKYADQAAEDLPARVVLTSELGGGLQEYDASGARM
jgi:hypothetical protein